MALIVMTRGDDMASRHLTLTAPAAPPTPDTHVAHTHLACGHALSPEHEAHAVSAGEARHGTRDLAPVEVGVNALVTRMHL